MKIDAKKHRTLDQCANLLCFDNIPPAHRSTAYDRIMAADYDYDLDDLDMFLGQLDDTALETVCMGDQDETSDILHRLALDHEYTGEEYVAADRLLTAMFEAL